jgi:hypothetical protein
MVFMLSIVVLPRTVDEGSNCLPGGARAANNDFQWPLQGRRVESHDATIQSRIFSGTEAQPALRSPGPCGATLGSGPCLWDPFRPLESVGLAPSNLLVAFALDVADMTSVLVRFIVRFLCFILSSRVP